MKFEEKEAMRGKKERKKERKNESKSTNESEVNKNAVIISNHTTIN